MMGCLSVRMAGVCLWLFLFSLSLDFVYSESENGRVWIDGERKIAETDTNFVCATIDWWPPQKCDFGTCSWDHSSLLSVVTFFFHLHLRVLTA